MRRSKFRVRNSALTSAGCCLSGDSGRVMLDSLQAGYKKLVILLRAVYTQTRQLPLWSRRRYKMQVGIST